MIRITFFKGIFMKTELTMTFEKATKNTFRFMENIKDSTSTPVIGTLYVQKTAFAGKIPQKIRVIIEYEAD
jgi:hypothetical protein